jgi:hypothetical protein
MEPKFETEREEPLTFCDNVHGSSIACQLATDGHTWHRGAVIDCDSISVYQWQALQGDLYDDGTPNEPALYAPGTAPKGWEVECTEWQCGEFAGKNLVRPRDADELHAERQAVYDGLKCYFRGSGDLHAATKAFDFVQGWWTQADGVSFDAAMDKRLSLPGSTDVGSVDLWRQYDFAGGHVARSSWLHRLKREGSK